MPQMANGCCSQPSMTLKPPVQLSQVKRHPKPHPASYGLKVSNSGEESHKVKSGYKASEGMQTLRVTKFTLKPPELECAVSARWPKVGVEAGFPPGYENTQLEGKQ